MRFTVALSLLVVALAATSTAQAHIPRICSKAQSPKVELACGKLDLASANSTLRFLKEYPRMGDRWTRDQLWRDHEWLKKYARWHISNAAQRMIPFIPHKAQWGCIHHYEGSWTDSGDPYWGGLQMDRGFMGTYGSDFIHRFHGYANVWPIWAQMKAAERAYSGYNGHPARYYGPWPNTAHYCGYL